MTMRLGWRYTLRSAVLWLVFTVAAVPVSISRRLAVVMVCRFSQVAEAGDEHSGDEDQSEDESTAPSARRGPMRSGAQAADRTAPGVAARPRATGPQRVESLAVREFRLPNGDCPPLLN